MRDSGRAVTARALPVFGAVLRKNALEFVRYPANMFFAFVLPFIWFIPTYFLIKSFAPDGISAGLAAWVGEQDFFAYLVVGLFASHVIMTIFWNIGFALKRLMDIGLLETLWVLPVRKIVYVLAESVFSFLQMLVELAVILLIYRYLFGFRIPPGLVTTLPYFLPFIVMMYGFGIGFAALVLLVKDANTMIDTMNFLVTGLSGTQNPPQAFPRAILTLSLAIPITYFIDIVRVQTLKITPLIPVGMELAIVIASAVIVPLLGALLFGWVDRRTRIMGTVQAH